MHIHSTSYMRYTYTEGGRGRSVPGTHTRHWPAWLSWVIQAAGSSGSSCLLPAAGAEVSAASFSFSCELRIRGWASQTQPRRGRWGPPGRPGAWKATAGCDFTCCLALCSLAVHGKDGTADLQVVLAPSASACCRPRTHIIITVLLSSSSPLTDRGSHIRPLSLVHWRVCVIT